MERQPIFHNRGKIINALAHIAVVRPEVHIPNTGAAAMLDSHLQAAQAPDFVEAPEYLGSYFEGADGLPESLEA